MYKAIEIARYIINKCIDLGRPISNLQLQKILYYVQGEYMRFNNGEVLFEDSIEAWQYGPVVPGVYYEYNDNSASRIRDYQEKIDENKKVSDIIDPIIESKSQVSAWTLVQDTHAESPWKNTYVKNEKRVIPIKELEKFFC